MFFGILITICITTVLLQIPWLNEPDLMKTYLWELFLQNVKYLVPCRFRDVFDVKCPLSGAKRVFGFGTYVLCTFLVL